jgi:hypothetical protein
MFTSDLSGTCLHVFNLIANAIEVVPVHEVPVADFGAIVSCIVTISALQNLWEGLLQRFR